MGWFDDHRDDIDTAHFDFSRGQTDADREGRTVEGHYYTPVEWRELQGGGDRGGGDGGGDGSVGGGGSGGDGTWQGRSPWTIPYTPWTETFTPSLARPDDLMTPLRLSRTEVGTSDAFGLRVREALKALEHSAAARGSYLTPNTMQALTDRAQDLAHDEYSAEWGRRAADRDARAGTYFGQLDRDLGLFKTRYDIHRNNQLDPFGMGMQIRGQDRADRSLDFDIDQGLWGRGITERREGRADRELDFSMGDITRKFDFGRDQDAWNRSRSSYRDYMDDLYRFSDLGTRRPPR